LLPAGTGPSPSPVRPRRRRTCEIRFPFAPRTIPLRALPGMKLTDLNRRGGIGANCLLVEIGELRLLVDCGLHPKHAGWTATPELAALDGREVDLILVTHCHLDHIGSLPLVLSEHPLAPVLTSVPSAMLLERMLHNSVNVMTRQRTELSLPELPLFNHDELEEHCERIVPVPYGQPKRFHGERDQIDIVFHPSGHVVGAAGVELIHKHRRIFFTGDVLFDGLRTLPGARFPRGPFDTIVMETTRGATERTPGRNRANETRRLISTIRQTHERGGSTLIPVFALGRFQEIVTVLRDAALAGELPRLPIFTGGFGLELANYLHEISEKTGLAHFRRDYLRDLGMRPLPEELFAGRDPRHNGLYVLSSGMLVERTPSYTVASCLLGGARNTIAFIGYCDPDTPGGRLLATPHGDTFLFDTLDVATPVKAQVERFELSGHADRDELMEFALRRDPRAVVLTHGDPEARAWFAAEFARSASHIKVVDPVPLEPVEV
jgi:Cft2 family RNA processing exonuclease